MGPDNSMISIEVQRRWEGLLYGPLRGGAKPLWEGSLRRGGYPPIPPLFRGGSNGEDGKARDPAYKRWDRSRLRLSAVGLCLKMADSLPFGLSVLPDNNVVFPDDDGVPDDLPVLPDDVLLIIAREYRLATAEDRALNGWYRVHGEMRYLPRCPKRKRIINLKGFYVPRHGNLLEPVTGYFFRRMMPRVFAKNADPRLYRWFRRVFGHDDYLRATQAAEWPYVHCILCNEIHQCGNEEAEEERQYQKD